MKFGAQISTPCEIAALDTESERLAAVLTDGTRVSAKAVIIATGARYRTLDARGLGQVRGGRNLLRGHRARSRGCAGQPVTVVGGANSAGQAALFLAAPAERTVTLAVRGPDLAAKMSQYLVDRILADPRIDVRTATEVTGLEGDIALERITLTHRATGHEESRACRGLFCFIGAEPSTGWLDACRAGSRRVHPHRRAADRGRSRRHLERARPFAPSVRDERARGVRRRRRPQRVDQASRGCGR